MYKRLLTLMVMAATLLTASAQKAGDYVYTDAGKFRITTGENLISNGDFTKSTEDWTTDGGFKLNTDTFSVENAGPDGSLCLVVNKKDNGPATGSSLLRKIPVTRMQNYVISYQVKGNDEGVATTITTGASVKNYQNIFFNTDGSLEPAIPIATAQTYNFDWTTFSYSFAAVDDGFIVVHFYAPYVATLFDNFSIMEAEEVIDDRQVARVKSQVQAYLENPLFANGHDVLEGYIAAVDQYVEEGDINGYNEIVSMLDDAVAEFLNQNSADITSRVPNGNFDDLTPTSANQVKAGAWTIDDLGRAENASYKTRWAVKSAADEGAPYTGNYLQDDYPTGYLLRQATVSQTLENMPAAQYMLTVKARANFISNTKKYEDREPRGIKVTLNGDETECWPIDAVQANTYSAYTTLAEPGQLKLGFSIPDSVANHVDMDVVSLRIIGWTQDQVVEYFDGKEFAEARQALKAVIDQAAALKADESLLYGKVQLDSAIVSSTNVYETAAVIDQLTDEVPLLNAAINTFNKANAALKALRETIATAEATLPDDRYQQGRDALTAAIDAAKAYIATLTADNHQEAGFTDSDIVKQTSALNTAIDQLKLSNTATEADKLVADEKFTFVTWAAADGAEYISGIDFDNPIEALGATGTFVYKETAKFAGNDLSKRFAFSETNTKLSLNPLHGLEVNPTGKNLVSMAILDLKEGDQVTIDWDMANQTHSLYVASANAKYTKADGTEVTFTKTGKQSANQLANDDNTNGLGGKVRTTLTMTAEGNLEFYQGSSNSTLRISYVGITYAENVADGIATVNPETKLQNQYYDLQGRRVSQPGRGLYIFNGKKIFIK